MTKIRGKAKETFLRVKSTIKKFVIRNPLPEKEVHCFIDDTEVSIEECDTENHDLPFIDKELKKSRQSKKKKKKKKKEIKKKKKSKLMSNDKRAKILESPILELKRDDNNLDFSSLKKNQSLNEFNLEEACVVTIIVKDGSIVEKVYMTQNGDQFSVNCT